MSDSAKFSIRLIRITLVALVLGTVVLALAFHHQANLTREERWRQDLGFFTAQFPALQMDFAKLYPPAQFRQDVSDLEKDVPQLSDAEVVLRLMRLVAAPGVAHNTVRWPSGDMAFHTYPLQLYWYSDGLAVIAAMEQYSAAIGARVVRIGSMTPEELENAVAPYISHENLPWLHHLSPAFMLTQEVATHFHLAAPDGSLEITLAKPGAQPFILRVAPFEPGARTRFLTVLDVLHLPTPFYRSRPTSFYWYEFLSDHHTLYIQYTRCANDPKEPFKDFAVRLFRFVDDKKDSGEIERVVVDLRFNQGGNSEIVEPLLEGLKARPALIARGHLYVLISRSTFSSGLLNALDFRDDLHAILVGEPTGGKANEYGEIKSFPLPNSHVVVQYTTHYFQREDSDPPSLQPDILITRSIADLVSGADPVLQRAIGN